MSKNCKLHVDKSCKKPDPKDDKKKDAEMSKDKGDKGAKCDDCAPWQRYLIYAIPFLLYIPWAIKSMKCPPKCCPPASTCPQPPPPPQVCCPKPPKERPKSEEPCSCDKPEKKQKGCD